MWRVSEESRLQTEVAWRRGVGGEGAGMEDTKKVTDGMAELTRAEMGTSLCPQCLEQWPAHSRCSANIFGLHKYGEKGGGQQTGRGDIKEPPGI